MQARVTVPSQTNLLDFKRADFHKLRDVIGRIPWMEILKGKTVQDAWETLKGRNQNNTTEKEKQETSDRTHMDAHRAL